MQGSAVCCAIPGPSVNHAPAVSSLQASAIVKEDTVGVWSSDTKYLYKLSDADTDAGFKSFFTAYDSFESIRESDVSMALIQRLVATRHFISDFVSRLLASALCYKVRHRQEEEHIGSEELRLALGFSNTPSFSLSVCHHHWRLQQDQGGEEVKVCVPFDDDALVTKCTAGKKSSESQITRARVPAMTTRQTSCCKPHCKSACNDH